MALATAALKELTAQATLSQGESPMGAHYARLGGTGVLSLREEAFVTLWLIRVNHVRVDIMRLTRARRPAMDPAFLDRLQRVPLDPRLSLLLAVCVPLENSQQTPHPLLATLALPASTNPFLGNRVAMLAPLAQLRLTLEEATHSTLPTRLSVIHMRTVARTALLALTKIRPVSSTAIFAIRATISLTRIRSTVFHALLESQARDLLPTRKRSIPAMIVTLVPIPIPLAMPIASLAKRTTTRTLSRPPSVLSVLLALTARVRQLALPRPRPALIAIPATGRTPMAPPRALLAFLVRRQNLELVTLRLPMLVRIASRAFTPFLPLPLIALLAILARRAPTALQFVIQMLLARSALLADMLTRRAPRIAKCAPLVTNLVLLTLVSRILTWRATPVTRVPTTKSGPPLLRALSAPVDTKASMAI